MERFYIVNAVGVPHTPGKPGRVRYVLSHEGRPTRSDFVNDAGRHFGEIWTLDVKFSLKYTLMNILCPKRLGRIIREERP